MTKYFYINMNYFTKTYPFLCFGESFLSSTMKEVNGCNLYSCTSDSYNVCIPDNYFVVGKIVYLKLLEKDFELFA